MKTKSMKYIYAILFLTFINTLSAQVKLGIGSTLIPEFKAFGAQVRGAYQHSEVVSFSGTFSYYFKKASNLGIDLDAQFKLVDKSSFSIAPFVGATIRRINSSLGTGLQAGFFIVMPTDGVDVYIEPKAILDDNTALVISGGLYF